MDVTVACDLRENLGPVRDQGMRLTCMAFSASDAHAGIRKGWTPLSCEYAFYHARILEGGRPDEGVSLNSMLTVLRKNGQPPEEVWPYQPLNPSDLTKWHPPKETGVLYRRDNDMGSWSVEEIIQKLDVGSPVIVTMHLSRSFHDKDGWDEYGVINTEKPPEPALMHAMVAVGHGTRNNETLVLVRNSWGYEWCLEGHCWISETFLNKALRGIAELTKDLTGVPTN